MWQIKQGRQNQALTLKALPSVSLHLPPVGLLRMFLQLLHATMVWAWLNTTAVSLHPPHLTSMKQELGAGTSLFSLWDCLSCSRVGWRRSLSICGFGDQYYYLIKVNSIFLKHLLQLTQYPLIFSQVCAWILAWLCGQFRKSCYLYNRNLIINYRKMSRLASKPPKKEVRRPISENFAPKRLAINFQPPTLIMEYLVVDTGKLYHHKMRLDSIFKKSNANRIDVLNYVKNKHYLYFLNGKVKDAQLLKFIDKIIAKRNKGNKLPQIKQETVPVKPQQSNFNQDDDFDYLNDDDEYEEDYEDYEQPEDKPIKQEIRKQAPVTHNAFNKNTFLTYCKEYEEESNEGGAEWDLDMQDADFV